MFCTFFVRLCMSSYIFYEILCLILDVPGMFRGMSRISGLRNDMNKRTFYKEWKINKRCIHFLSKQTIKVP